MSYDKSSARLREALGGESPETVARRAGVHGRTVRNWRDGAVKTAPRMDTVEAVATATHRAPAWLAGWDDGDE